MCSERGALCPRCSIRSRSRSSSRACARTCARACAGTRASARASAYTLSLCLSVPCASVWLGHRWALMAVCSHGADSDSIIGQATTQFGGL